MDPLRLADPARERLDRAGQEFLVGFLDSAVRRDPSNLTALAELGHAYTRLGRHREGLDVDRQLVRLDPGNPVVHYNLACSLALLGNPDEALDALVCSVELGYGDVEHLLLDEDLTELREERRFVDLVRRLRIASAH